MGRGSGTIFICLIGLPPHLPGQLLGTAQPGYHSGHYLRRHLHADRSGGHFGGLRVPQELASVMGFTFTSSIALILPPIVPNAGFDPVHFGVIMIVNLAIDFVTPADWQQPLRCFHPDQIFGDCHCQKGSSLYGRAILIYIAGFAVTHLPVCKRVPLIVWIVAAGAAGMAFSC